MGLKTMLGMVLLVVVAAGVRAELVDLSQFCGDISRRHNDERRNVWPTAADMREMVWDDDVARHAEEWAGYCRYERPPRDSYDFGSNLAYSRGPVKSFYSVQTNVYKALDYWAGEKRSFQYSTNCGRACAYTQMVYSASYKVGCAMKMCGNMKVGTSYERNTTLFICFYSPRGRIVETYPYRTGASCSACPMGTYGSGGLCVQSAVVPQTYIGVPMKPDVIQVAPVQVLPAAQHLPLPNTVSSGRLTPDEIATILDAHNRFRRNANCIDLLWDEDLKKWSDWIIDCTRNYPGPEHSYTNFFRCNANLAINQVVYAWSKEGMDSGAILKRGCRTPYDNYKCNHYTNMIQPSVSRMACSACLCNDGNRQLVCIYDDPRYRKN